MAHLVSARSRCSRDRVGCAIVDDKNELLAIGYNGAAPSAPVDKTWCVEWCDRAIRGSRGEPLDPEYADCHALHAEFNAIMSMPRSPDNSYNTLYVNSAMCYQCAKAVAAAIRVRHISRIVMKASHTALRQRDANTVVAYLQECGVEVVIYGASYGYRRIFQDAYGLGPHECYFCRVIMPRAEVIHHKDHDHSNDAPDNLAAAHAGCHSAYHMASNPEKQSFAPKPRVTITNNWTQRKPYLKCKTCGISVTPGWLKAHASKTGHDGSAYDEWVAAEAERKKKELTCECGREFTKSVSLANHKRKNECA
jgi:deoxycytidylate deaminase